MAGRGVRIPIRILILLMTLLFFIIPGTTRAQSPGNDTPATVSAACFAEVQLGYWADILRGPSYAQYGIKRTIPSEQRVQVIGQDETGGWVQVYYPRTDIYGWMLRDNMLFFGRCTMLPLTTDTLEPDGPAPTAPHLPRPAFIGNAEFVAAEQVFAVNDAIIYALHERDDRRAHILLIDLLHPAVRLDAALTGEPGRTMGTVSDVAQATGAFVALNGDFWTRNRVPQNLMLSGGDLITAPTNRATFALTPDNEPYIGTFTDDWTWDASITAQDGGSIPLQLLNTGCENDWLCLYTDIYAELLLWEGYDRLRVLLNADYEVLSLQQNMPLTIPTGHMALRTGANSQAAAWLREHVAVGDTLSLSLPTDPDWRDFEMAIGGGPLLIADGDFWQDCDPAIPDDARTCENFDANFRVNQYGNALQARSAVGYTDDSVLILVMVEGNDVYGSRGSTQRELADIFLRMGAVRAMEFDGGRSSALWVGGNLVNGVALEAGERRVSNALLVFVDP